jgi:hypothetical protein
MTIDLTYAFAGNSSQTYREIANKNPELCRRRLKDTHGIYWDAFDHWGNYQGPITDEIADDVIATLMPDAPRIATQKSRAERKFAHLP